MWLLTNFGAFSAVHRTDKIEKHDNRVMQVRARRREHLEALQETFMQDEMGPIFSLEKRDYKWRAYCTQEAWARACYAVAMDVNYTNFKNSVKDDALHEAYANVWQDLYDLQIPGKLPSKPTSFTGNMSDEEWERYMAFWDTKYNGTKATRTAVLGSTATAKVSRELAAPLDDEDDDLPPLTSAEVAEVLDDLDSDRCINISQAATKVGTSQAKLRKFMRSHSEFVGFKSFGGQWQIPMASIEDLEFKFWSITAAEETQPVEKV